MIRLRPNYALMTAFVALSFVACGEDLANDEESPDVADATFALNSTDDCVGAFATKRFLRDLARQQNWEAEDIVNFCSEITRIATAYEDDDTLTVATIGGGIARNGPDLTAVHFYGIAGYNVTAIREWLGEVRASRAISECSRRATRLILRGQSLPPGFVRMCLEEVSGAAYPAPIFTESSANLQSDDDASGTAGAVGLAATLLIYNAPGQGTIVSFLAGGFYGQATNPPYFAVLGCGVVSGFGDVAEVGSREFICMGSEY